MDELTTRKYRISLGDMAEPCVIEAPCFGVAMDYYLATHGLFGYDGATIQITDAPADESIDEVLKIYPEARDENFRKALNEHHRKHVQWLPKEDLSTKVRDLLSRFDEWLECDCEPTFCGHYGSFGEMIDELKKVIE